MTRLLKTFIYVLLVGLASHQGATGQSKTEDSNWIHYTLDDSELGDIEIHVSKPVDESPKPMILYLEGSGNFPLLYSDNKGRVGTAVTLNINKYKKTHHVVLISKPGIPFRDSLSYTPSGRRYYPRNQSYTSRYSLDWRSRSASLVIDFVLQELSVDKRQVVVMGHSEGSQVAPAVAAINDNVTHVVAMMGNALNHLYDFLIEQRVNVLRNEISPEEGQRVVDSLFAEYEKIYADPQSISKSWYGETYYKWSSFTTKNPLDHMLSLDIPILYLAGGMDAHTIINMDFARLEFMRAGKTNLTYKVYPGYDHYFQETIEDNGQLSRIDHIDEVHDDAMRWVSDMLD